MKDTFAYNYEPTFHSIMNHKIISVSGCSFTEPCPCNNSHRTSGPYHVTYVCQLFVSCRVVTCICYEDLSIECGDY
jgi:hypothetical protein